ncbi:TPR-like protein [Athelia psychrophila]|uniref:TPR-like protein n=1 Tax=Athelia psychrophila TaxID=1759441 RepID=A0A166G9G2_9AGAM|nr:TPR-like protein [Fibularhizoctonia sp. CBS 109695]
MDKYEVVFNTPGTVGGSVINIAGNYIVHGGDEGAHAEHMHQMDRALKVQAFTEGHPLPSFNDAPVDLISSCFTGRREDVQCIANAFASPTGSAPARYAIWGMPGLGKSQLGLKYAHSSFESGRHTHIFAISATTVEKLTQGLTGVLELVQHSARHNPDQSVQLTAARHCFEHPEKYGFVQWLIIFDNATSETVSFLRQHLPRQNANGSILITTRTLEIARALTNVAGQQHPICELKALSPIQSAELLLKTAGIPTSAALDLESAKKLVERMGCLPLAVAQAGALMKQNGFKSADRLNNLYDQHGLGEIIGWTNSLSTYEETSVMAAFTAPLQQLGANNPDVLSLLRVLAYLDPENIPLDIIVLGAAKARAHLASHTESASPVSLASNNKQFSFRRLLTKLPGKRATPRPLTMPQRGNANTVSAGVPLELRPLLDSICSEVWLRGAHGHLEDLSLARLLHGGEKTSIHIHDLIRQVVVQQTAAAHAPGENPYLVLAITLLSQAFKMITDTGSPQSWTECERFVPHFMALENHVGALPIGILDVLSVRFRTYFWKRGRYEEAAALGQREVARLTQQVGAEHPKTLNTVSALAALYYLQGKYNEAEALYQRALAGQTEQLGADHPQTLNTVHGVAALYRHQGKYNESEAMYQRALAGREQQLGADHPITLDTVNNFAVLRVNQGRYNEAEALFQRALAALEQQLGADHPDTLSTANNVAALYRQQGNYIEAETLYRRVLASQTEQLGADHPSTSDTVYNIALLYRDQGKYDAAGTLYKRALAGNETSLGIHHPSTIETMNGLAGLYDQQGRHGEANTLRARAEEAEKVRLSK